MKRYVVFERVQGSKSWTIATKPVPPITNLPEHLKCLETDEITFIPAMFHLYELAEKFVNEIQSKKLGWWGGIPSQRPFESHIAEVDCPD